MTEEKEFDDENKQKVLIPGNSYGIGKKNYDGGLFIAINDPLLDDKHALIEIAPDGKLMLTDLYSDSGTYVKGDRLTPFTKIELRGNRMVVMGNTCCTFIMAKAQLKKNDSSGFNSSDIFDSSIEEAKTAPEYFLMRTVRVCKSTIEKNATGSPNKKTANKAITANLNAEMKMWKNKNENHLPMVKYVATDYNPPTSNNTTIFNLSFGNNSVIDNINKTENNSAIDYGINMNISDRAIPETQYGPDNTRNFSHISNDDEEVYIPETQEILPSGGIANCSPLAGIPEQSAEYYHLQNTTSANTYAGPLELDPFIATAAEANQFLSAELYNNAPLHVTAGISGIPILDDDNLGSQLQLCTQDFNQSVGPEDIDNMLEDSLLLRSPPVFQSEENCTRGNHDNNRGLLDLDWGAAGNAGEVFAGEDVDGDADLTPDIDPQHAVLFAPEIFKTAEVPEPQVAVEDTPNNDGMIPLPEELKDEGNKNLIVNQIKKDEQMLLEGSKSTDADKANSLSLVMSAPCGGIRSLDEIDHFQNRFSICFSNIENSDQSDQQRMLSADVAGSEAVVLAASNSVAIATSSFVASNRFHSGVVPPLSSLAECKVNNIECKRSADSRQQAPILNFPGVAQQELNMLPPLGLIVHDDSTSDNKVNQNSMNCSSTPMRPQTSAPLENYFEEVNNTSNNNKVQPLGTPNEVAVAFVTPAGTQDSKVKINQSNRTPKPCNGDGKDLVINNYGNKIFKGKRLDFDKLLLEGPKPENPSTHINQSFSNLKNYILNTNNQNNAMEERIADEDHGEVSLTNNQYSVTNLEKEYGFTTQPVPEVVEPLISSTILPTKVTKILVPDMIINTLAEIDKGANDVVQSPVCVSTATTDDQPSKPIEEVSKISVKAKRAPKKNITSALEVSSPLALKSKKITKSKGHKLDTEFVLIEIDKPKDSCNEVAAAKETLKLVKETVQTEKPKPAASIVELKPVVEQKKLQRGRKLTNLEVDKNNLQQKKSQRGRKRAQPKSNASPTRLPAVLNESDDFDKQKKSPNCVKPANVAAPSAAPSTLIGNVDPVQKKKSQRGRKRRQPESDISSNTSFIHNNSVDFVEQPKSKRESTHSVPPKLNERVENAQPKKSQRGRKCTEPESVESSSHTAPKCNDIENAVQQRKSQRGRKRTQPELDASPSRAIPVQQKKSQRGRKPLQTKADAPLSCAPSLSTDNPPSVQKKKSQKGTKHTKAEADVSPSRAALSVLNDNEDSIPLGLLIKSLGNGAKTNAKYEKSTKEDAKTDIVELPTKSAPDKGKAFTRAAAILEKPTISDTCSRSSKISDNAEDKATEIPTSPRKTRQTIAINDTDEGSNILRPYVPKSVTTDQKDLPISEDNQDTTSTLYSSVDVMIGSTRDQSSRPCSSFEQPISFLGIINGDSYSYENNKDAGNNPPDCKRARTSDSSEEQQQQLLYKLAQQHKVLKNCVFLSSEKLCPLPVALRNLIECAGGTVLEEVPKEVDNDDTVLYLISSPLNKRSWNRYRRANKNIRIIGAEAIPAALQKQTDHELLNYAYN